MVQISAEQFASDLPGLLDRIAAGESFVVTRGDRAVAEVRPVEPKCDGPRPIGLGQGDFVVPDDFDAPLPEDLLRLFEGE